MAGVDYTLMITITAVGKINYNYTLVKNQLRLQFSDYDYNCFFGSVF